MGSETCLLWLVWTSMGAVAFVDGKVRCCGLAGAWKIRRIAGERRDDKGGSGRRQLLPALATCLPGTASYSPMSKDLHAAYSVALPTSLFSSTFVAATFWRAGTM